MTNKYNYLLEQSMQNSNYNVAKNVQARKRMFNVYNTKSKVESVREFIGNLKERFILFSAYSTISFDLLPESSFNSINKRYDRLEAFMNEEANSLGVIKMVDFGVTFPNLKIGIIQQIQTNEELFLQRALRCCNLDKDGRIAKIYIFVCKDTVDEKWLAQALKNVKKERIKYMEKNFEYK